MAEDIQIGTTETHVYVVFKRPLLNFVMTPDEADEFARLIKERAALLRIGLRAQHVGRVGGNGVDGAKRKPRPKRTPRPKKRKKRG